MLFIKGLLVGLAIAAPVGPIGVLCIQRTLHEGFSIGLATGLGAALADGTYGLMAAFGLTALSNFLIKQTSRIQLIGAVFLFYLGLKLLFKKPTNHLSKKFTEKSMTHALSTTYILTLANPITILSFIAIFAGLGLGTLHASVTQAVLLVAGITFGSALWWVFLTNFVARVLHKRINNVWLQRINILSGFVLMLFGAAALYH